MRTASRSAAIYDHRAIRETALASYSHLLCSGYILSLPTMPAPAVTAVYIVGAVAVVAGAYAFKEVSMTSIRNTGPCDSYADCL